MRVGLDIGSTTIKCVVLNDAEQIVYSTYERHYSHILEKGKELLHRAAQNYLPDGEQSWQSPVPPVWPCRQLQGALCAGSVCHPRGRQQAGAGYRLHH